MVSERDSLLLLLLLLPLCLCCDNVGTGEHRLRELFVLATTTATATSTVANVALHCTALLLHCALWVRRGTRVPNKTNK